MTTTGPTTLPELTGASSAKAPWLVSLVQPEVGGGRVMEAELAKIGERPDATALMVSGLDQKTFETLVARYGRQFVGIHFWKCPRVADFSPLEHLPRLEQVAVFWNQRAERLWDFTRTPLLRGLAFEDFTRLHDLEGLASAQTLEELRFGDKIWSTSVFTSLEPVGMLQQLHTLSLDARRFEDDRVEPIARLRALRRLHFPPRQFTTRQIAWLRARLPEEVECTSLVPTITHQPGFNYGGKLRDVLLVGRRQPFLSSTKDAKRIARHTEEFQRLVDAFRADPSLTPS